MELEGKVALVTGASGGIGAAVARKLHDAGASVGLLSRRGDDLGLERGLGLTCDVRDRAAVAPRPSGRRALRPPRRGDRERGRRGLRAVPRPRPGAARGDDRREPEGHALHGGGDAAPPDRGAARATSSRSRASPAFAPSRARPSTTRRSSVSSASRAPSTTSCASGGCEPPASVRVASRRTSRSGRAATEGDPELEGMLTADEVADVVLFTVTRPRRMRILTTSFRPMIEASWG